MAIQEVDEIGANAGDPTRAIYEGARGIIRRQTDTQVRVRGEPGALRGGQQIRGGAACKGETAKARPSSTAYRSDMPGRWRG